jgi:hypothetical protein
MSLGHSPRIVTDGLVMCLDPANVRSYAGSGITVTDISLNQRTSSFNQTLYLTNTPVSTAGNGTSAYIISIDLGSNWVYEAEYAINSNNNFNTLISYGSFIDGILLRSFRVDTFYVKGVNYYSYLDVLGTSNSSGSYIPVKVTCFDNSSATVITVYRGTSTVATVTTTSGLNPATKSFRIGQAIHATNEGLDGGVRNIAFTKTIYNGSSVSFPYNGTDTALTSSSFTPNISNKTLSAWCRLNTLSQTGGGLITLELDDGSVFDSIVYNETSNGWGFGSNSNARTAWSGVSESSINSWVYLCATYSNNDYKLYRNGVQILGTSSFITYTFSGSSRVLLGKRHTGGSTPFLSANIAQSAVYSRALSAAEVLQNYNALKGRFSS